MNKNKLPDGWREVSYENILEYSQYGTNEPSNKNGSIPIIGMKDIQGGKIKTEKLETVILSEKKKESFLLHKNDILINRTNSLALVGKAGIFNSPIDAVFTSYIVRLKVKEAKAQPSFINLVLNSTFGQRNIKKIVTQAISQANLNPTEFKKLHIYLPPLPEQNAIADTLSVWDTMIEKTEQLIAEKEKLFKSYEQKLIMKPATSKKWNTKKAGKLFTERIEMGRKDLPLLSITGSNGVIPHLDTNRKDSSSEDKSKYLRICKGDIGYNTMRMWQGVSALSELEGIVSPAYTICIPSKELFPQFIAYLFKTPFMIHRFYKYSQGLTSDTWNLKFNNFSEVTIPFPDLHEQRRIAEILDSAQREIDLLKQLLEHYKKQKRGLMQKLLTGAWRIQSK